MSLPLAARLNRAGIEAGLCTSPQPGCGVLVEFRLAEMEEGDRADQPSRVPGAALDRSIAEKSGDGWLERWFFELSRADEVVRAAFDIGDCFTMVNKETGQVYFAVFNRDRSETARWLIGFGWV